jgi:hypothetical protein
MNEETIIVKSMLPSHPARTAAPPAATPPAPAPCHPLAATLAELIWLARVIVLLLLLQVIVFPMVGSVIASGKAAETKRELEKIQRETDAELRKLQRTIR